ncbi:MAG: CbiX/SirB N-terminal domain-containing protein [Salinisphaera sp.]|nr:CbiX/SirB N-terminal domain-containing protein [Salinisphaera sp.]
MTPALLLVAHGSRLAASNEEVRALTQKLRNVARGRFCAVDCAFLELAEPSIPDGIDRLIAHGAAKVVLLPYFLAAGRHVSEDIPALLASKRAEHPQIDLVLAPYLGTAPAIVSLLLTIAEQT